MTSTSFNYENITARTYPFTSPTFSTGAPVDGEEYSTSQKHSKKQTLRCQPYISKGK